MKKPPGKSRGGRTKRHNMLRQIPQLPPKKQELNARHIVLSFPDKKLMANEIWAIVYVNRNGRKQNEFRGLVRQM
jgi:hypothetical protein